MSFDKESAYALSQDQLDAILAGINDRTAIMATINCVLKTNFPYYFWVGFYMNRGEKLLVGPYQGTMGCLEIEFGRGVCGTAASERQTQVVPDVHMFPGHIACDAASQSEIVVPVYDKDRNLIAVFDVDSTEKESFDEVDQRWLEQFMQRYLEQSAP